MGIPGLHFHMKSGHLFPIKIGERDWVGWLMGGGIGFGWVLGRFWSEGYPTFI